MNLNVTNAREYFPELHPSRYDGPTELTMAMESTLDKNPLNNSQHSNGREENMLSSHKIPNDLS